MLFDKVKMELEAKGYKVTCCDTVAEALKYIDKQIDNQTVGMGGSVTIEELGLYDKLSLQIGRAHV